MAGIWDIWYDGDYDLRTFSIITGPPNAEVAPLHDRMPMLLHTEHLRKRWLAELEVDEVMELARNPAGWPAGQIPGVYQSE